MVALAVYQFGNSKEIAIETTAHASVNIAMNLLRNTRERRQYPTGENPSSRSPQETDRIVCGNFWLVQLAVVIRYRHSIRIHFLLSAECVNCDSSEYKTPYIANNRSFEASGPQPALGFTINQEVGNISLSWSITSIRQD